MLNKKYPVNVRINKQLRDDGKRLFKMMGINPTTAVILFLEECKKQKGLPFTINYMPMAEYAENNSNLQVEVDGNLKKEAREILKKQGLTISEAINLLYRQTISKGELPF